MKIISNKIKCIITEEKGFLSTIGLVLVSLMTVALIDMARLSVEDDKNRQFLQRKTLLYNDLLSAVNETRWEMYHYYQTGEGSHEILQAAQGQDILHLDEIYQKTPNATIKRRFYAAKNKQGGYWYFTAQNKDIAPSLKWYFQVENNHIKRSFWGP